jgi:hypothetical protein
MQLADISAPALPTNQRYSCSLPDGQVEHTISTIALRSLIFGSFDGRVVANASVTSNAGEYDFVTPPALIVSFSISLKKLQKDLKRSVRKELKKSRLATR